MTYTSRLFVGGPIGGQLLPVKDPPGPVIDYPRRTSPSPAYIGPNLRTILDGADDPTEPDRIVVDRYRFAGFGWAPGTTADRLGWSADDPRRYPFLGGAYLLDARYDALVDRVVEILSAIAALALLPWSWAP